jgi:3-oxoadipate enol-lactonase
MARIFGGSMQFLSPRDAIRGYPYWSLSALLPDLNQTSMATQFLERVAVEIDGNGDAVLLLHGLGGSSNTWTPIMAALARHRPIRLDLPGSARSSRVEGPLSIAGFVECVKRVLDFAGVSRAHVVGHSLGTIIAMHLALSAPAIVRSLCLFGPLLAPPDTVRDTIRTRGKKARDEGVPGMQLIADAVQQATTSSETKQRRPSAMAYVRESLMRQDPDGYARTCDALADAQAADTAAIDCPTLLITGDEDVVAPPQMVRQIANKISGARVEILRGCGHWTPVEKPEECSDLLRQFLNQRVK